ncbi:MAG: hypothetical protein A2Z99_14280 [Treponema sp. GWB1_62_6]|nr:MAG: hypothetical protein A2Z99_14280 [Treponema sp. GWB1_62_6]
MKKYLLPIMLVLGTLRIFSLDIEILDEDLDLPLEGARVAYSGGEVFADPDGKVSVELPGGARRLVFSLPGYDDKTVVVQEDRKELTVRLRMSGIIEGQELVVEKAVPLVSDSQAGVAVAVSERQMESTAQIGVVEDVMSTIKTLPGVGYAGGWNARPSIRGGSPSETTVVLDGFEVIYPYHWGGAFSIFNPNMVDSAKLSAGLVSARYGRNISGLLEINSKTPDKPSFGFEASLTTTGTEAFVQAPLGKDAGLLLGGKLTWMEVSFALAGADGTFNQVPFIRDGYGKFFWKPADRLSFYANAFFGSDGVGVKIDSEPDEDSTIQTKGAFDWINLTGILSGGLKWLPTDTLLVQAMGGWNRFHERPEFQSTSSGEVEYSQAFLDKYDGDGTFDLDGADNGTINGAASFAVDGTYFEFLEDEVTDIFQGRGPAS